MNMQQITAKKNKLERRVLTPGYQTTLRDVAEAQELVNTYIDELERLENTATPSPITNTEPIITSIIKSWYTS